MDFCFWLDADDCLLPEDQERFRQLKAELTTETDVVPFIADAGPHYLT